MANRQPMGNTRHTESRRRQIAPTLAGILHQHRGCWRRTGAAGAICGLGLMAMLFPLTANCPRAVRYRIAVGPIAGHKIMTKGGAHPER